MRLQAVWRQDMPGLPVDLPLACLEIIFWQMCGMNFQARSCVCCSISGMLLYAVSTGNVSQIHSSHLYAAFCGIFHPDSASVAHCASFLGAKSPTNCDVHLAESNLGTHSKPVLPRA